MTIGLPTKDKNVKKKQKKQRTKAKTKTKRDMMREAEHLAEDLEANLLRLKEEMENEVSVSGDESVPISSMKGGYFKEGGEWPEYTPDTSMQKPRKFDRTKSMISKSKTLSRTLDISGTNEIHTMNRKVEKQESLRDIIANNKMSLQWRKERIKEYGRVKKKAKKQPKMQARVSHSPKGKPRKNMLKLNSKLQNDKKRSNNQTPKNRNMVTGEYESCLVGNEQKSRKNSYEWLLENSNSGLDNQIRRTNGRFDSNTNTNHGEIKRQFKMATGEQNVTLAKIKRDKDKKDKHFEKLVRKNTNNMNESNTSDISGPLNQGEEFVSETSIRMRRKTNRKTDLKKKLDLDRLKNLSSKMQKRNSMMNSNRDSELPDREEPTDNVNRVNRKKTKSEGGSSLLKDLHSKFMLSSAQSKKIKSREKDFSIEIKVQGGKSSWNMESTSPPKIISELGSGNDLMVKNQLIQIDDDLEEESKGRNLKLDQYRRDRIKEYGQKLKHLGSKDRKAKKTNVNPKEFLENL
jgi:hypothetical protein